MQDQNSNPVALKLDLFIRQTMYRNRIDVNQ